MSPLTEHNPADIGGKARQLRELQRAGFRVPEFLCSPPDLARAIEQLGTPLAVRSSGSAEDGVNHSFAGQFRSFLNQRTLAEVTAAVAHCEASVQAPSVVDYCRKSGLAPASLRMGVIVQRMVQPELAGVAFTVNPATGAEEVVIEACLGLADDLLAGRQAALPATHPLLQQHAPAICETARSIHRHFGAPQDIEFAIEGGQLFILQTRPITRIQFAPDTGEWTNADFRDGGVSSGACTALMWSLYDFIWEPGLKGFLREIKLLNGDFTAGKMFFGRPYWNLGEVKSCLARLPGFVEREFDLDLSVQIQYEGDGVTTPTTLAGYLRALPTVLSIPRIWREQARFNETFLNGGFEQLIAPYQTLPADPGARFEALIQDAYRTTEGNYFRTIFCVSLAKIAFQESFPDADFTALVSALPALKHLDPTRALREMAQQGQTDLAAFIEQFGHHSRRELDLRYPRWDEDPEWVRALLKEQTIAPTTDPRPAYEEARAAALARLPWHQRRRFAFKLDRLRHFLWLREEMRDVSSRMYHLIRRYVLAVARQRGLGEDIFHMTFPEIIRDDRSQIESRRATYESYRHFKAPNEIGVRFACAPTAAGGALRGVGASGGTVRGIARVARNIESALRVEKGAILVCPYTDPGWTPVLDRVAGVITETGGLLSHAAVICREYGIPAVLGIPDATARIPDGAFLTLYGSEGRVELGDPAGAPSPHFSSK